jgi:RimJ/RimL family protein N-acetyltransferase
VKYFRKLISEKIYLSPVSLDDVEKYTEWINDMETGLFVNFASGVFHIEKERMMLENSIKENSVFAIIEKDTNKAIGICGIHNKDIIDRTGTFGIFIGDKSYWSQGFGAEATMLILDFAFNILNLNNVNLDVVDFNKRGIKCYEKCGFKYSGKRRQAKFVAGQYHDLLTYDILASEFESPYVKKLYTKTTESGADAN